MFGLGFGLGGRQRGWRLGALVLLLAAALVFHRGSHAYELVRIGYAVVVVAVLLSGVARRRRGAGVRRPSGSPTGAPAVPPADAFGAWAPPAHTPTSPDAGGPWAPPTGTPIPPSAAEQAADRPPR